MTCEIKTRKTTRKTFDNLFLYIYTLQKCVYIYNFVSVLRFLHIYIQSINIYNILAYTHELIIRFEFYYILSNIIYICLLLKRMAERVFGVTLQHTWHICSAFRHINVPIIDKVCLYANIVRGRNCAQYSYYTIYTK